MGDDQNAAQIEAQEVLVKQLEGEAASIGCKRTLISLGLLLALIVVVYGAYHSHEESLQQLLLVELASGLGLFFAAPFFLRAMKKKRGIRLWIGLALAAVCFFGASMTSDVTRLLLIEATGGLVVLLIVETYLRSVLETLSSKLQTAEEKREQLIRRLAAAKDPTTWEDEVADYFGLPRRSMFPPPVMGPPQETEEP